MLCQYLDHRIKERNKTPKCIVLRMNKPCVLDLEGYPVLVNETEVSILRIQAQEK